MDGGGIKILGTEGEKLGGVGLSGRTIRPGEYVTITETWQPDELEGGQYQAAANIDYKTGKLTASQPFSIPDSIEIVPEDDSGTGSSNTATGEKNPLPLWLILMALTVLGVLMYSFDIDPIWIIGLLGILGASTYILLSSVSNLFLLIPLIVFGIIFYLV
jgi:hypothetical protein